MLADFFKAFFASPTFSIKLYSNCFEIPFLSHVRTVTYQSFESKIKENYVRSKNIYVRLGLHPQKN